MDEDLAEKEAQDLLDVCTCDAVLEIRIRNWSAIHSLKIGAFYRLSLASPLKMRSKFVLAN